MGFLLWFGAFGFAAWAGGPVGGAVVIGLWIVLSVLPQRRLTERVNAASFDHGDWSIEFATMTASISTPDDIPTLHLELRRDERGRWYSRHSEAARAEFLENYEAAGRMKASYDEKRVRRVVERKWDRFDGQLESLTELAYQRFLRTL